MEQLSYELFIQIIQMIFRESESRFLSKTEEAALRAAWKNISYSDYAQDEELSVKAETIKQKAYLVFPVIRKAIRFEKLNKKNIKSKIETLYKDGELDRYLTLIPLHDIPIYSKESDIKYFNNFIGRVSELKELRELCQTKRCIHIWGEPGIGKTALVNKLKKEHFADFTTVIDTSLRKDQNIENWAVETLESLGTSNFSNPISGLTSLLAKKALLLIIDNAQNCKEIYDNFIFNLININKKSVVIIISNTQFQKVRNSELSASFNLQGLIEYKALFEHHRLSGQQDWLTLYQKYRGNIAQLLHAIKIIKSFFNSDVSYFIESSSTVFSDDAYAEIDANNLSSLDIEIINLIVSENKKTPEKIFLSLKDKYKSENIFNRIGYLENISFIKKDNNEFTVLPIVKKYVVEGKFETL